jgi:hypothetical protein
MNLGLWRVATVRPRLCGFCVYMVMRPPSEWLEHAAASLRNDGLRAEWRKWANYQTNQLVGGQSFSLRLRLHRSIEGLVADLQLPQLPPQEPRSEASGNPPIGNATTLQRVFTALIHARSDARKLHGR